MRVLEVKGKEDVTDNKILVRKLAETEHRNTLLSSRVEIALNSVDVLKQKAHEANERDQERLKSAEDAAKRSEDEVQQVKRRLMRRELKIRELQRQLQNATQGANMGANHHLCRAHF